MEKQITQPEIHEKVWGHEEWIANTNKYCGKKLVLKKGFQCSLHYHKNKDETFYVQSGNVRIDIYPNGESGNVLSLVLEEGDTLHIYPGLLHRFYGLENSEMFEFSTLHEEEDSYRLEESKKMEDFE